MDTATSVWIIGGSIVLTVILLVAVSARKRRGAAAGAKVDSMGRRARAAGFRLRRLTEPERIGYLSEWERIQARFVEEPSDSVREANRLVVRVLRRRGPPVRDPATRWKELSVNYPELSEKLRSAHAIHLRNEQGRADADELRRAIVHYRGVFSELLAEESLRKIA